MARIAKSDVHAALRRAADHMIQAGGPDGIISRKDIKEKLTGLKGVERRLVDIFFRFIDYRDAGKGARVTAGDVEEALAYAKERMIDKYDLNQNGLSEEEIIRMSLTGRLAVALARILKRSALKEEDQASKALYGEIEDLLEGLFFDDFGSEAAEKLFPVYLDTRFEQLTEENFAKALDLDFSQPKDQLARFMPVGNFWEDFVDVQLPERRAQALNLVEILRANLRDIHIIIVGADQDGVSPQHPVYVVGLSSWGDILGLRSTVIWT